MLFFFLQQPEQTKTVGIVLHLFMLVLLVQEYDMYFHLFKFIFGL